MVSSTIGKFGVGKSSGKNNQTTPPEATRALLSQVRFKGEIWECACGNGRMVKVLEEYGYDVLATDKYVGKNRIDFLDAGPMVDNIVTNPPFDLAEDLIHACMPRVKRKMALFLRLAFLESDHRYDRIFTKYPLEKVIVFSSRVGLLKPLPGKKQVKAVAYAWFIWNKQHKGEPTLCWTGKLPTG